MKKIISMLLIAAVVITFMTPVMAKVGTESSTSASTANSIASTTGAGISISAEKMLENAIKAVKAKIDIPKDCDKFTYNIYNRDNGVISWNLGWSNEEIQKHINVTIDENDLITSYSSYQYSAMNTKKIPKYSKVQGQKIAEIFINNLDPKVLSQYKLIENSDYNSDRDYNFNYIRHINGIAYNTNNLSVSVNKYTGEVSNYNSDYSKNTTFEDATKVIKLEQAKKAFIDKLGLKLVYIVKTEKEKPVTYLAYVPKDTNKYIDALTGEVETTNGRYGIAYDDGAMEKTMSATMGGSNANVALTPDEINSVKGISNLISKEDADKKIRAISIFNLDSEYKLSNAYLSKGWNSSDLLIWSLTYSKVINKDTNQTREIQVSIEAKSGEVQNFWTYYQSAEGTKPQKTKEQAKVICDDVLKELSSNYAKLKFDDTYYNYYEESQNQFTFRYVLIENGLECPSNYINIIYDNLSGNVTNMDSNWTRNLKFDAPTPTISLEKAYDILFSKIGYAIQYINDYSDKDSKKVINPNQAEASKAVLGYFVNNNKPNIISAATGDLINYSGNVYKENVSSNYTDIKGLKAQNQIEILTQMAIKYNESELKPNESLLQKDYLLLLCKLNDLYYFDQSLDNDKIIEQMYNELINQGIITKAEKVPSSTITKEQAAKYFIKFLKFGQIAEIKGIYKSDFKDTKDINPDLIGYVCIASGLKAINGNDGYFKPKSKLTRLDGLLSIYSYLSNK